MTLTTEQRAGMHSSSSAEWYTPPDLLAEIVAFLGPDYYDPCPPHVRGEALQNALWTEWRSPCYANPPYGRGIEHWVDKALSSQLDEVVLLVPARTETAWFRPLYRCALLFIHGRLHFSGAEWNAPFPSVLAYKGPRVGEFAQAFAHRGTCMSWVPARPRRTDLWSLADVESEASA